MSGPPEPEAQVGAWIAAARGGSREALGHILEASRQYLLMVANRALDSDLQAKIGTSDLVQDTFLEAARDFPQFQGASEEELRAWLCAILRHNLANCSRAFHQAEKRQIDREICLGAASEAKPPVEMAAPVDSPSAEAAAREESDALSRALAQLPVHYRQTIEWRSLERRSFEEIGKLSDCSAEAARKLWGRAVILLQDLMGQADGT